MSIQNGTIWVFISRVFRSTELFSHPLTWLPGIPGFALVDLAVDNWKTVRKKKKKATLADWQGKDISVDVFIKKHKPIKPMGLFQGEKVLQKGKQRQNRGSQTVVKQNWGRHFGSGMDEEETAFILGGDYWITASDAKAPKRTAHGRPQGPRSQGLSRERGVAGCPFQRVTSWVHSNIHMKMFDPYWSILIPLAVSETRKHWTNFKNSVDTNIQCWYPSDILIKILLLVSWPFLLVSIWIKHGLIWFISISWLPAVTTEFPNSQPDWRRCLSCNEMLKPKVFAIYPP